MDEITLNKEKIVLKFSEEELALLCNALNEVCNGIGVPEFDSRVGTSIENASTYLKFMSLNYEKAKQFRLDQEHDL